MKGRLELIGASKEFPGVKALREVDFDLRAGEVHVLLGENGAGKSTLIKMLAGVHRPDTGELRVDGAAVRFNGPDAAEKRGISTIHQEMALVPQLTVAENIYLGRPPRRFGVVDRARMRRDAAAVVARMGLSLDVDAVVGGLGVAQRQTVEIAKALSLDTRFLIMDEPTAVLSRSEAERLFGIVRDLTERGVGVVFISHLLDEVAEIGDRVTVLRDGAKVAEVDAATSAEELVRLMVGRSIEQQYPHREQRPGDVLLEVSGLGRTGEFAGVGFSVRAGEVVGIGGLVGAGRTELVRTVFGADRADAGEVRVAGRSVPPGDIRAARDAGLALVPEDRAGQGLVLGASVEENIGLATLSRRTRHGLVDLAGQRGAAVASIERLRIRTAGPGQAVGTLSGGNQQKIVIGKWLLSEPKVLIMDEPTRGIDVGAKVEIYELINRLTEGGAAVLIVSSDLTELLGMSDRVLVMADGRLRGELGRAEATQEKVMALAVTEGQDDG
ncbi:monosaccharide ABC transporter ATP-binding protein (CUT2 family) [Murinocardiopsis flavida]|uniref:Monosaccharide ABC transporter ATP-binding protein (CUT2 family) n=1 Tax=Murinocardiopsis flavida TaxID=645275 RepID=A0A2P8DPC0_9ACTN|nr:sugar ABC transporter ATP-binding protein [Murinocardiopsis flavida]PSK99064.1 monosaccharide ABC transporter ATP-binding protein (CUT2 family) [Murinocardiopsis flavida]